MRTLLIDNYDSYTFNLFQLLAQVNRARPIVVPNDCPWDEIAELDVDNIVLSPGPGEPTNARDGGICGRVAEQSPLPLLGVCLGHQLIVTARGGTVGRGPQPAHGVVSRMHHDGSELFAGIGAGIDADIGPPDWDTPRKAFSAVRYHSLVALEPLPDGLVVSARSEDGLVMALRDPARPVWGVQFHPESILTPDGARLLANFRDQTLAWQERRPRRLLDGRPRHGGRVSQALPAASLRTPASAAAVPLAVRRHLVASPVDAEAVVAWLLATDPEGRTPLVWLDSASHPAAMPDGERRAATASREDQRDRFSYIALPGGPLTQTVTYDAASATITIHDGSGRHEETGDVLEWVQRHLPQATPREDPTASWPAHFCGGFAGYFGYDTLKEGRDGRRRSQPERAVGDRERGAPDTAVVFVDRLLVIDHAREERTLVWLGPIADTESAQRWFATTDEVLANLAPLASVPCPSPAADTSVLLAEAPLARVSLEGPSGAGASLAHREWYAAAVRSCREALAAGESYELCLTTQFVVPAPVDHFAAYRALRRRTPAPFAALLRFGAHWVLSASPEQLLSVTAQHLGQPLAQGRGARPVSERTLAAGQPLVATRPIKGTAARRADPAADAEMATALLASAKDRSEHLMIVDLVRNDLGRVCTPGTVVVEEFMTLERHPDVYQMVSTVVGRLQVGLDAVDALRALFPPGSMTGAPKHRTMELLEQIETTPRGVYAGALGWLGVEGSAGLSVVIRTIVSDGTAASVGAGGAIVWQSQETAEYEELLVKARAPLAALADERLGARERQCSPHKRAPSVRNTLFK